jgi:transcriptional regulator with GAF, ATPase, and Fis domain
MWRVLQSGVGEVIVWRNPDPTSASIAARLTKWEQIEERLSTPLVRENLVGRSRAGLNMARALVEGAAFSDSSVLLMGESGTGKELAARVIHGLDQRPAKGDFVVLDCSTIVPELAGSEFFGHERGAFTGAITGRDGAFALANGGTLFLDEVGELPLPLQAQLLRVIQERTYKRVGGNSWFKTDFRLICATNRDLAKEVAEGRFRSDLYYRLAAWTCTLPSLRERRDDILPLTQYFLRQVCNNLETLEIDRFVQAYLVTKDYPGNIRELRQLVMQMVHRHAGTGPLTVGDIPESDRPCCEAESANWCDETFERCIQQALAQRVTLKEIGRTAENLAVRLAIEAEEGSLQRAAARLGVTDRALQLRRATNTQWFPERQSDTVD